MFLLGVDLQHGGLPVSAEAVEKAIELNGEAVAMNLAAFRWGRRAAHDPATVREMVAAGQGPRAAGPSRSLDEMVAKRAAFLTGYQNAAYARQYQERIARLRAAETNAVPGSTAVTEAAARYLFKLMAIKDEYEVARLYTDGSFARQLGAQFESYDRLEFHLAPPILGRKGNDGKARKSNFGPWMTTGFRMLAALKGLRGGVLDVFGYTHERRMERRLLADYRADLDLIEAKLGSSPVEALVALASVPELVRGYGHVKAAAAEKAGGERRRLIERVNDVRQGVHLEAAE